MDLAPLDQREVAKRVAHRAAQRLGPVNDEQAGDIRFKPARDQVGQQRLDHGGVLRRAQGHRQHAPSMPTAAAKTCSSTRSPSIWITNRSSDDRSAASHSFSFAVLSATNRRDTEDFVVAHIAWPARSPSGNRIERAYLRVATPISIWLNPQRDASEPGISRVWPSPADAD